MTPSWLSGSLRAFLDSSTLSMEFSRQEYWSGLPFPSPKWALGSITMNKASGGDEILAELFQILKDDAGKV